MNIANLDLNLLRIFDAIMRTKNVSEAGAALGLSQPATSFALAKLRKACGDTLFVRTPHGMQPTPRAQSMAEPVRHVLSVVETEVFKVSEFNPLTADRTFVFSMTDIGEMVFLPKLLTRLRVEAPNIVIKTVTIPAAQLESDLESGAVDIALGYFPDLKKANFYQQRLFNSTFACVVRTNHPVVQKRLTLKQFLTLSHAVVRAEGRSQEVVEHFLVRHGLSRPIGLHIPHFMSVPYFLADTDYLVTVPLPAAVEFTKVTPLKIFDLPLKNAPGIELKQHWHARFHRDVASKWMRKIVYECFAAHDANLPAGR